MCIVLSNPQRRKHYDKYGTVEDDMHDEDVSFKEFERMFGMGGKGDDFFDHFDDFTTFLESDTKFMRKMFRDIGKDVRIRGKRRKQKKSDIMGGMMMDDMDMAFGFSMNPMEDMLSFLMGAGDSAMFMKPKKNKKSKKAKN